jgi:phosphomannomutase
MQENKPNIKFTISGLRGVWGENLNESVTREYITAFAVFLQKRITRVSPSFGEGLGMGPDTGLPLTPSQGGGTKPRILIGNDARKSGPIIKQIAIDILTQAGFEIIDTGLTPTPTVLFLVRTLGLDGAIMLTASHNPPEYNGIKFVTGKALFTNREEVDEIQSYLRQKPDWHSQDSERLVEGIPTQTIEFPTRGPKNPDYVKEVNYELLQTYIDHILAHVDVELIKSKKFTVVLDAINSVGSYMGPQLLTALGCTVTTINGIPNGEFAHMPEPLPENLTELGEKVTEMHADIGFALDPDGDRLVVCDETGTVVFEEYMLTLAISAVLKKTPGNIVTNLSTSNTNKDLIESFGFKNYRTKVGEANVVEGITDHNAVIGGEGSGGVIYPAINLARDGFVGMALILESLALEDKKVSQIIDSFSKYIFVKEKIPFTGDLTETIQKVVALFPQGISDTQDGLRLDFADNSWIQLRTSNTEPIIRIFGEGKNRESIMEKIEKIKKSL